MISLRSYSLLGGHDNAWLKARLHVAVAGLGKPEHHAIGPLVAWNDDQIAALSGFPLHSHQDMEIVTYVRDGAISHQDSLGNRGRTVAGDIQVMSAGTGIRHSEWNAEESVTRIFQIWLRPRTAGGVPRWESRQLKGAASNDQFEVLATGYQDGSHALSINADARILGATMTAGRRISRVLGSTSAAYLVPVRGTVIVNGHTVHPQDGAYVVDEEILAVEAVDSTEVVMVEVSR